MSYPTIRQFDKALEAAVRTIPFDPKWNNGTGYFDHLVKDDLGLESGEVARSTDNLMRNIIVIGSPLGNLVVFERRARKHDSVSESDPVVVVTNLPSELRWLYSTALTADEFDTVMGIPGNLNLGERLADIQKALIERHDKKDV